MHRWCKFGENMSNTLQDIVLTMFRDARTEEQDKTIMAPATLPSAEAQKLQGRSKSSAAQI